MFDLTDILLYVVLIGFEFVALCAMTRVGRGWPWQLVGLLVLVGLKASMEAWYRLASPSYALWVMGCFIGAWFAFAALVMCLSRERCGRRLFLATTYGMYSVCHLSAFHALTFRNVFDLSDGWACAAGLAVISAANLVFIFVILPLIPRDGDKCSWTMPCIAVGFLFILLCVSGVWPISVLSASGLESIPFMVTLVISWVVFPGVCRFLRDMLHRGDVERNLAMLMAEMKERRAVIDQARRLRHDQRHHRVQLAEYLLRGQNDRALAYLRELDDEAAETPTDRLVWCNNETINAILASGARKAAAHGGVEFSAELHVEPTIDLPDLELVVVLANLIENAIHAACACGGRSRPQVRVRLRQRTHGLGIQVENPVPPDFTLSAKGMPCENPGIGLESVRWVVERHSGEWSYTLADGVLTCNVVLMVKS